MREILTTQGVTSFETSRQLAIDLWNKGDYGDARRVLLDLQGVEGLSDEQKLIISMNLAMVARSDGKFSEALRIHQEAAELAASIADLVVKAKHHNGLANTYLGLKQYDKAFEEFTAVSVYMEHARNFKGCAEVQNNIGNLKIVAGCPEDAHNHLDVALQMCDDLDTQAQVWDTRARALAAQGKDAQARKAATKSLELTIAADNERLLYAHLATFFAVSGVTPDLDKLKHAIESNEIRKALTEAGGSVYRAAPKLGLTCEGLRWKLKHQHPDLLHLRTPERRSPILKSK